MSSSLLKRNLKQSLPKSEPEDGSMFHFLARYERTELILCSFGLVSRPTTVRAFSLMRSEGSKSGALILIRGGAMEEPATAFPLSSAENRLAIVGVWVMRQ